MAQAPNKRQDDFDMAKLRKSLKQQDQRRSSKSREGKIAKLTPAEIRSLNHSASTSKAESLRSVDGRSAHRVSSSTPPLTPDAQPSHHANSLRRSSAELPTPPRSPQRDRRDSNASGREIHTPRPVRAHANKVSTANPSRPSSVNSYRGVATYRGPELTRTGSLTMLQYPSQQIVSNPLSNFSRPRQSTLTSSPDKPRPDMRGTDMLVSPMTPHDRSMSMASISVVSTRQSSLHRRSNSPVSIDERRYGESDQHKYNDATSPTSNGALVPIENPETTITPITPRSTIESEGTTTTGPTPKQRSAWRRTFTGFTDHDRDQAKLKKESKRKTMTFHRSDCIYAIQYDNTKPGPAPSLKDSLKGDLPSAQSSIFKPEDTQSTSSEAFEQHPAVRPPVSNVDREISATDEALRADKGKAREIIDDDSSSTTSSSYPAYSRCTCCGRVQKPNGFMSELSPVLENENLRTNFSFEAERSTMASKRRSGSFASENPRRYTPIIPMEVGDEVRQAAIAPPTEPMRITPQMARVRGVAINKVGDIIGPSSQPLAIMPRSRIEAPKVVRFASLHVKPDPPTEVNKENMAVQVPPPPPVPIQRFGSLYGRRDEGIPAIAQSNTTDQPPALPSQPQRPTVDTGTTYPGASLSALGPQHSPRTPLDTASNYSQDAVVYEKPGSGDSPQPKRVLMREEDLSDDEHMVDLSSFDGSFVRHSLSRSATKANAPASPPSKAMEADPKPWPPPEPDRIAVSTTNKADVEASKAVTQTTAEIIPQDMPTSDKDDSDGTSLQDRRTQRNGTTTVVRIVPSASLPSISSSMQSSPRSLGPMRSPDGVLRLGDWVLPDTPSSTSRPASLATQDQRRSSMTDASQTRSFSKAASTLAGTRHSNMPVQSNMASQGATAAA